MSTEDLTFQIPTIDWEDLSNEEITSLFLFGTTVVPTDLNDRIKPVVLPQDQIGNDPTTSNKFDIVVRIDEAGFTADDGPARFANISKIDFVDLFFTRDTFEAAESNIDDFVFFGPEGQRLEFDPNGEFFTLRELTDLGFVGFGQNIRHSTLSDSTDDKVLRTYIWETQRWFLDGDTKFFFHKDKDQRKIIETALHVSHDDFDFTGGTNEFVADQVSQFLDPYEIGRTVGFQYDRSNVQLFDYTKEQFDRDSIFADPTFNRFNPIQQAERALTLPRVINLIDSLTENQSYYNQDGFEIVYGSAGSDVLSIRQYYEAFNQIVPQVFLESILVGGPGSDQFIGIIGTNEQFLGGDYDLETRYADAAYNAHRNDIDTVNYSLRIGNGLEIVNNDSPIMITLGDDEESREGFITVTDEEGGTDLLQGIERIIGSLGDDPLKFSSLAISSLQFAKLEILGSPNADIKDNDTLDLSDLSGRVGTNFLKNFSTRPSVELGGITFTNFETLIATDAEDIILGIDRTTTDSIPNQLSTPLLNEKFVREQLGILTDPTVSLRDKFDILTLFYTHEYDNLGSLESVELGEGQNFLAADGGRVVEKEQFLTNPEEVEAGEEPIYDEREIVITPGLFEVTGGAEDDIIIIKNAAFQPEEPAIPDDPDTLEDESKLFVSERRAEIDSGGGDDYVITFGGVGAITVGGEGRDFIFNTSEFGQIYGDTLDGLDSEGNELDHTGSENADTFWYWPGTFIQDAQPNDRITLFGLPLVGGSNAVGGVAAGDGSAALDFFSFGTYYTAGSSGQLAITNLFARLFGIGPEGLEGTQVVENYTFGGFSDEQYGRAAPGDLGLTFRIFLPLDRALEGVTISLFNAVWGSLFTVLDAAEQLAKLILWLSGMCPIYKNFSDPLANWELLLVCYESRGREFESSRVRHFPSFSSNFINRYSTCLMVVSSENYSCN